MKGGTPRDGRDPTWEETESKRGFSNSPLHSPFPLNPQGPGGARPRPARWGAGDARAGDRGAPREGAWAGPAGALWCPKRSRPGPRRPGATPRPEPRARLAVSLLRVQATCLSSACRRVFPEPDVRARSGDLGAACVTAPSPGARVAFAKRPSAQRHREAGEGSRCPFAMTRLRASALRYRAVTSAPAWLPGLPEVLGMRPVKIVFPKCNRWRAAQAAGSALSEAVAVPRVMQPARVASDSLHGPPPTCRLWGPHPTCRRRSASPGKDHCSRSTGPLSSRPLGRDAAVSHGASIFSFPGQNPDSRRQGGRPALASGPCAARAEDSLCGARRVPEAVRYEGHSELRRAVGANAAGLPHGHAPPRALVAAPGPEPTCVKSFHLTHIVREVTRLASHRAAGGGFPLKTTAAFEQAPEGTFLLLLKLRQ